MRITILYKCIALLLISILAAASYLYYCINLPLNIVSDKAPFEVNRGDNISKVANRLNQAGILQHPELFILFAYMAGDASNIKAGEYLLDVDLTPSKLLQKFTSGDVVKRQITFLEGWTFRQILEELKRNTTIDITSKDLSSNIIMEKLGFGGEYPEGRFFPDSYRYEKGTTDLTILQKAHERMGMILQEEWQQRDTNLPYKNSYDALIMASIIEKETGAPSERSRIASVFINRLKKGMPLQTDPTVIYGMGDSYKGNLTRADLQRDTPYNTYVRTGLPPTPIANPSREAIHAALHPASDSALYFVGKGDGTHYFSQTLTEHNKAVRQYQLNRRNDNYRSSPSR
jgi:UPF0755 protein